MKRYALFSAQVSIDLVVMTLAFCVAFLLRFDWAMPADMVGRLALTVPYVVLGEYLVFALFGVPRFSWRYVGLREVRTIFVAATVASGALLVIRLVLGELQFVYPFLRHGVVPNGVIAANYTLLFLAVCGVRVLRRLIAERAEKEGRRRAQPRVEPTPTMLVGAGQCGLLMARELANRPDLGLRPVGFIDDDPDKLGTVVHGIPVVGASTDLQRLCAERGARQVIITIASASGKTMREIVARCEEAGLPTKIIPGLYELADGAVNISRIRDVAIEDLLGRDAVQLEMDTIGDVVTDRVVMVTGAGGSIGSELCRQLCRFRPKRLLLVERAENALFQIHRELEPQHPSVRVVPLIADVTDVPRMESVFRAERPALVLHAAAHKHVPMMEWNPSEALKNNVLGTAACANLASRHGAERFVLISTDKAVNPTSVMGATKRIAEMYVQSLAGRTTTRFATVRFGNVLGSAGSVIPIFKEQIARGGPVTVTHPEMRRYFMTIPEACQLVLQAGAMGQGGEIFVLDMGEPVRIVDLARDLIALSGLQEGEDIEIAFVGTRPGEKLFEEIVTDSEAAEKTRHPKILIGKTRSPSHTVVEGWLRELETTLDHAGDAEALAFVRRCVPEFRSTPSAVATSAPPAHALGPPPSPESTLSLRSAE